MIEIQIQATKPPWFYFALQIHEPDAIAGHVAHKSWPLNASKNVHLQYFADAVPEIMVEVCNGAKSKGGHTISSSK